MEFAANKSRSGDRGQDPPCETAESHFTPAPTQGLGTLPTSPVLSKLVSDPNVPQIVTGNAGDHKLVHALLRAVYRAPSYEDFVTWLDDPTYEPTDRLLIKHSDRIVGHVQVLDRVSWFNGIKLPTGGIQDLVTLPEYCKAGHERQLLSAAEQTMCGRRAVVAFARTDRTEVFRACGWNEVRQQRFTQANVGDILANLAPSETKKRRRNRSLQIRLWRHVELDALRRVYCPAAENAWGAVDRSELYWRWLVGRKAHDELIVAIHGNDHWDELDKPAHIVGYAVTHGSQVVELCCLPGFAHAAPRLLARACQDAIEQDHRSMSLLLPEDNRMHELMIASGGHWCDDYRASAGTLVVKLLDAARWIECIYPLLQSRARAVGIARPHHITFDTGGRILRLDLTRRSGRLTPAEGQAADVRCAPETMSALLVGNLEVGQACDSGELLISESSTAQQLAALFPPTAFWQSPFDLLRF